MPLNLAQKFVNVSKAISHIEKGGHNENQNYDFVSDADVLHALRNALLDEGVATVVSVQDAEILPFKTSRDTPQMLTSVSGSIEFINADDKEETFIAFGQGQGADGSDKGLYKAITGMVKYILLKTFLVPTGDDPENASEADKPDESKPRQTRGRKPAAASASGDKAINEKQRAMFMARVNDSGLEGKQRVAFLIEAIGKGSTKEMTNADLDKALERLADEDLIKSIIADVKAESEGE